MKHRILTLALAATLPFTAATLLAQQQTTNTTSSTTQSGIDPATGQPYTAQHKTENNTQTNYDGSMRHSHTKASTRNTTVNPDGTVSRHAAEHSRSHTMANNPDGTTTDSHSTTTKTENSTTP